MLHLPFGKKGSAGIYKAAASAFSPSRLVTLAVVDDGGPAACAGDYFARYCELKIDSLTGQLYLKGSEWRFRGRIDAIQFGIDYYVPLEWERFSEILTESDTVLGNFDGMNGTNWQQYIRR